MKGHSVIAKVFIVIAIIVFFPILVIFELVKNYK